MDPYLHLARGLGSHFPEVHSTDLLLEHLLYLLLQDPIHQLPHRMVHPLHHQVGVVEVVVAIWSVAAILRATLHTIQETMLDVNITKTLELEARRHLP